MRTALVRLGVILLLSVALLPPASAAPSAVVRVKMEDSSSDKSIAGMRLSLDRDVVEAGPVSIVATNLSQELIHEVIVVKLAREPAELPYNAKQNRVIESRIAHLGEVSDLKPGASGKLTLKLKPGSYLLICNQPGHYRAGMSASLTVVARHDSPGANAGGAAR